MPVLTIEKREQWFWVYEGQFWRHNPTEHCAGGDCAKDALYCPTCHAPNPDCFTWGDVMRFARVNKLDEEAFSYIDERLRNTVGLRGEPDKLAVYASQVTRVAVWWCPGSNEGYYIHIERHLFDGKSETMMIGKGWSLEWAEKAEKLLSRYVHTQGHYKSSDSDEEAERLLGQYNR